MWWLFTPIVSFFTANYLVHPALFQVVWLGHHLVMHRLLSRLLDPHTLHWWFVLDILSMQLVNCDFVVLLCNADIYFLSVRPGRRINHCCSSWGFFHLLFLTLLKGFFSQHGKFFLTWITDLRTEDVFHCTDCKVHWGTVIVISGCIYKID